MGVAGKGGGAGAVGLEWKKTCHQLRIIKQKFVNPVQHLRTSKGLYRFHRTLAGMGFLKVISACIQTPRGDSSTDQIFS